IELDRFQHNMVQFSDEEFDAIGINAEDGNLIRYMAERGSRVGHAIALTTILG
ncbi:hypothetical protein BDQ17DRAFT_1224099, partial [Cyathus striatus]